MQEVGTPYCALIYSINYRSLRKDYVRREEVGLILSDLDSIQEKDLYVFSFPKGDSKNVRFVSKGECPDIIHHMFKNGFSLMQIGWDGQRFVKDLISLVGENGNGVDPLVLGETIQRIKEFDICRGKK